MVDKHRFPTPPDAAPPPDATEANTLPATTIRLPYVRVSLLVGDGAMMALAVWLVYWWKTTGEPTWILLPIIVWGIWQDRRWLRIRMEVYADRIVVNNDGRNNVTIYREEIDRLEIVPFFRWGRRLVIVLRDSTKVPVKVAQAQTRPLALGLDRIEAIRACVETGEGCAHI